VVNSIAYVCPVKTWRTAMSDGLYGPGGFFTGEAGGPSAHFRTSVHASALFARAVLRLVERMDEALGHPDTFDLVDVGAGRGELLAVLRTMLPAGLAERARLTAVEVAPRPAELDQEIGWRREIPDGIVGLLIATEWLDNVPLDVADLDDQGRLRKVLVDPVTGEEALGGPVDAADRLWLERWWPGAGRVEIGSSRDEAWADAVGRVRRGFALTVDYGHLRDERPAFGSLTGFRGGRQVAPVPDGTCDLTADVAIDSIAGAVGTPYEMMRQRAALKALGIDGARPSIDLARSDPAAYLRALSAAGEAAELREPAGLGGHWWLLHTIGVDGRGSMLS
jgi:SAM-dependent MidA family methyltransferase